jgi:hypothetical protein
MATPIRRPGSTYGQTVSVKYYANQRLKSRPYFTRDGKTRASYPLYTQIVVRGKTVVQKSILNAYIPPDLLDNYLKDRAEDVAKETEFLQRKILDARPFEVADFSLSKILSNIDLKQVMFDAQISHILSGMLREALNSAIQNNLGEDELCLEAQAGLFDGESLQIQQFQKKYYVLSRQGDLLNTFPESSRLPLYQWVQFYSSFLPEVKAVRDSYPIHLWRIQIYCNAIRENTKGTILTIADWKSGKFNELFLEVWKDTKSLECLNNGINLLITNDLNFNKLF